MPQRKNEAIWIESRQQWQIKEQRDGERRMFTSKTPGKKGKIAAERKADKWLESKTKADVRFDRLWKMYIEKLEDKIKTEPDGTVSGTAHYTKQEQLGRLYLLPDLKHKKISTITDQDWQNCIDAAEKMGLSKKTCKNIRGAITAVCRFGKRDKYPIEMPEDITIPKDAPVAERNILQPKDLQILFSQDTIMHYGRPKKRFYIHAWRLYVVLGIRRGELCGLRREDVKGRVLYITKSINSSNEMTRGKNRRSRRYFALCKRAQKILDDQAKMLKSEGVISPWLFPDERGERSNPNHIYKQWLPYRRQHGIGSSIHEMRHTFVSITKADMPEALLKRLVGHSASMDTTGVYGQDVDGELERAANIIDQIFDTLLNDAPTHAPT